MHTNRIESQFSPQRPVDTQSNGQGTEILSFGDRTQDRDPVVLASPDRWSEMQASVVSMIRTNPAISIAAGLLAGMTLGWWIKRR